MPALVVGEAVGEFAGVAELVLDDDDLVAGVEVRGRSLRVGEELEAACRTLVRAARDLDADLLALELFAEVGSGAVDRHVVDHGGVDSVALALDARRQTGAVARPPDREADHGRHGDDGDEDTQDAADSVGGGEGVVVAVVVARVGHSSMVADRPAPRVHPWLALSPCVHRASPRA